MFPFDDVIMDMLSYKLRKKPVWGGGGGGGVTKAPFVNFSVAGNLIKENNSLDTLYHIHICQVSPQLSYGDTCQIWT